MSRVARGFAVLGALACCTGVAAPLAAASEQNPTMGEIEREVICPSCGTTLDRSDSQSADRMRVYIRGRIEAGWTRQQVLDGVVEQYGGDTNVLARTPTSGLGALAWAVPAGVLTLVLVVGGVVLARWRAAQRADGAPRDTASSD